MSLELVFATTNEGKLREVRAIAADACWRVVSMAQAGIHANIVEDGATFEENALKKARAIMQATGKAAMADDSGLEIDCLDKKPGVHSSRFLGENTPYHIKHQKILDMLKDTPAHQRTARFVSVVAAVFPDGRTITARGELAGAIAFEAKGTGGFGYDPLFYLPEWGMTLAEMPPEQKNALSHRRQAFDKIKQELDGMVR